MCVGLAASELSTSQARTQTAPARERVDTDNAFAVVQVGRCMPSGLLGGGRSLKETSPASPLSSDADDDDADSDPELAHDDDAVADDADADDDDAINGNARDENAKSLQLDVSNLKSNLTNVTEERDLLFAEVQTLRNSIALHTKQL